MEPLALGWGWLGPYVVSGLHLSKGSVYSSEEGWSLIPAPLPAL